MSRHGSTADGSIAWSVAGTIEAASYITSLGGASAPPFLFDDGGRERAPPWGMSNSDKERCMSVPNEADFAIVKISDGGTPASFAAICGIENVSAAVAVNASDRFRRDCAKPGIPGSRKNVVTGKTLTITASGAANIDNVELFEDLIGIAHDYEIEFRQADGSDAGVLQGTYSGSFMLMSHNLGTSPSGDSSGEIVLNNDGPWVWTPA